MLLGNCLLRDRNDWNKQDNDDDFDDYVYFDYDDDDYAYYASDYENDYDLFPLLVYQSFSLFTLTVEKRIVTPIPSVSYG